jgi:PAS domain S-box-containing protein
MDGSSQQPGASELLHLILSSATDFALFTMDRHRRVTSWNDGAERLLGYRTAEIIGRNADVIFTPEDRAAGAPEREIAKAAADGRAEDERWHLRKDGSRFWGSGQMASLRGVDAGFIKIMRDRTAEHEAQARLLESESRFRSLATSIPQLVFRTRADGRRTWGSPQWEIFAGLSDADSRGLGWLGAVHPDDRQATLAAFDDARATGQLYVEHRIRHALDGEYRWHQTRAAPALGSIDGEWVGTSADIHDIRSLQDQQKVLVSELQHRTRNLLAIVQATARSTMRGLHSLDEFIESFEDRLQALSRAQEFVARADHEPLEMSELVRAELAVHGDIDPDKIEVRGSPLELPHEAVQILSLAIHELATNAVKHGALGQEAGRLRISWELTGADSPSAKLAFRWREAGVAMTEAVPRRQGFGTELIERALVYQLGASTALRFQPDGIDCSIVVPLPAQSGGRA